MTLKNILQWENSRAVGPCCLINRDFKRQCRISMVLQGSVKGQARGVGGKKGRGGGQVFMDSQKTLCWHLNLLGSSWRANAAVFHQKSTPTRMKGSSNNLPYLCMYVKLHLFWSTNRLHKWRQDIQLCQREFYSIKSKDKRWKKTAQSNVIGQRRYLKPQLSESECCVRHIGYL